MIRRLEHRVIATSAWTFTGEADYPPKGYCDDPITLNTLILQIMLWRPPVAGLKAGS